MRHVLGSYLLVQVPGWFVAGLVLWGLHRWGVLGAPYAAALLVIWIAKDLLLFPAMRRFYEPEPVGQRMVGESGTAVTALTPHGLVRVRGELWKAQSDDEIAPGARVCVLGVQGLTLLVREALPRDPETM